MATIDEELSQLERDVRQLKIEYEMFFGGGRKRPPTEIEWRIELITKRYAERAKAHPVQGDAEPQPSVETVPFRVVCSEPEKEVEKVDQLYEAFVRAKQQAGEETSKVTHAGFKEFVRKKTKDLQTQKNCRDVEYVVEMVEGQVKLKALVKS